MNRKVCGIYQVYLNRKLLLLQQLFCISLYTRDHNLRRGQSKRLPDSQFLNLKALFPQLQPSHTTAHTTPQQQQQQAYHHHPSRFTPLQANHQLLPSTLTCAASPLPSFPPHGGCQSTDLLLAFSLFTSFLPFACSG